jgi:hypothetical protein
MSRCDTFKPARGLVWGPRCQALIFNNSHLSSLSYPFTHEQIISRRSLLDQARACRVNPGRVRFASSEQRQDDLRRACQRVERKDRAPHPYTGTSMSSTDFQQQHLSSFLSYPFVWPRAEPSFRPDPRALMAAARRVVKGGRRQVVHPSESFSRPSLDRPEYGGKARARRVQPATSMSSICDD